MATPEERKALQAVQRPRSHPWEILPSGRTLGEFANAFAVHHFAHSNERQRSTVKKETDTTRHGREFL